MDMDVFEELSEPSRRYLLKEMLDGPRNVSQLVESTGLKQPNVSNHWQTGLLQPCTSRY